jgi:hypothetical protein
MKAQPAVRRGGLSALTRLQTLIVLGWTGDAVAVLCLISVAAGSTVPKVPRGPEQQGLGSG